MGLLTTVAQERSQCQWQWCNDNDWGMIVAKGMGMGQSCKFNQRTAVFLQAPTIITAAAGRDEEVQLGLGLTDSSTSILYRSVLNGAMTWV